MFRCALSDRVRIEHRLGAQLQAQGADDPEDRVQTRITFSRKRLVETFAGQAGIACNLRHALGAGDVAQRLGNERGVAIGLLHASFQVCGHFLRCAKVLGDVVR